MGAFLFTLLIIFLAVVLDTMLPESVKDRMTEKFMEGGERIGSHD